MNSTPGKDVIYIDVDDEITAIIDKVRSSQSKITALVLPKRATTLQSIVNMKLLKRSADAEKKHLVLITSEAGLMPLAANVGMYVAKTLQSKPEIPDVPQATADVPEDQEEAVSLDNSEPQLSRTAAVGDLAKDTKRPTDPDGPIELDKTDPKSKSPVVGSGTNKPVSKKNRRLNIPNFSKFRLLLIAGAAAIILLVFGLYLCLSVLPKANILVKTDSEAVNATVNLTLNTQETELDKEMGIVPAKAQQAQKTFSQQQPASGQKNVGQKASGTVRFYNCNKDDLLLGDNRTVPAGTGISTGGMTFITTSTAVVEPSNFDSGGNCKRNKKSDSVGVVAQNPGAQYNVGEANYSVAGSSTIGGEGSAMAGGTDQIMKIVQQSDIDAAKQKMNAQDATPIKQQLQKQLSDMNLYPITSTFNPGSPAVTSSVKAGDQADSVTVTQNVTYTMLGAKTSDLEKLVADAVKDEIDTKRQEILDYGLGKANFNGVITNSNESTSTNMQVTVVAGSRLNIEDLKKQVAGKKSNEAKKLIGSNPGVTDVDVSYSPFWVNSIPGKTGKITITIDKPQVKSNAKQ